MSSLYVDRRGIEMRLDSGALSFHENEERIGSVPTGGLERIYLRGDVRVTSGVLGRLGQLGIGIIILSGRKAEPALFLPRSHNDASLRVEQTRLHLDEQSALKISKWLVKGKIRAQLKLIEELKLARPGEGGVLRPAKDALFAMVAGVDPKLDLAALRGIEGAAAAWHFKALAAVLPPSLNFSGRNRRPPRDPVNAILSLGYTMLMSEAALAAHGHGFGPAIGFLHALDFGRPSFACDLAEPLRPVIDRFAWRLFADQTLRVRDFSVSPDGACLLMKTGRERFYEQIEEPLSEARRRLDVMLQAIREMIKGSDDAAHLPDHI
jgi:CRISPR-associated protein Cas1